MFVAGPVVFVGGEFGNGGGSPGSRIAAWTGSAWVYQGSGIGNDAADRVNALAWHNGVLYAAGLFDVAGGVPARNIAKWDGVTWSSLGTGLSDGVNGEVYALTVLDDQLYVGGGFNEAGGELSYGVARWSLNDPPQFADGFENVSRSFRQTRTGLPANRTVAGSPDSRVVDAK